MIRFLFLTLIFVLGLGGAVLWYGQMHHLRLALPDDLPGWSDQIDDTARLREGKVLIIGGAVHPDLTLRWKATTPSANGLRWDITLTGAGVDLGGQLVLPFWPDHAVLTGGSGTVQLDEFATLIDVSGLIRVDALSGRVDDLMQVPQPSGSLSGALQRVAAAGAELGDGPLRLALDDTGAITGSFGLRGGISAVDGALQGQHGVALGQLDLRIDDVTALPAAARGPLETLGTRDGAALQLTLPVPLP